MTCNYYMVMEQTLVICQPPWIVQGRNLSLLCKRSVNELQTYLTLDDQTVSQGDYQAEGRVPLVLTPSATICNLTIRALLATRHTLFWVKVNWSFIDTPLRIILGPELEESAR